MKMNEESIIHYLCAGIPINAVGKYQYILNLYKHIVIYIWIDFRLINATWAGQSNLLLRSQDFQNNKPVCTTGVPRYV